MKKTLAVLLLLAMMLCLSGCGDKAIDSISDYVGSEEFQEDAQKWGDEINSLLD